MAEPAAQGATGAVVDPYRNYNFKLEIQGIVEGHFTECSGLSVKVHTVRYREAGVAQSVRVLPGAVEYADVALRYGLTRSRDLWDWLMRTVSGQIERRNLSICVLEPDGVTEALRWNLINAFPSQWYGATFDGLGREAAIEQLTLSFDKLERA